MENSIAKKVIKSFPFPVAVIFSRLMKEEIQIKRGKGEYQKAFLSLIDLFEMLNRFLATLIIADYYRNEAFDKKLNNRIAEKFNKKLSLGDWHELFRECLRAFSGKEQDLFIPDLFTFYFKRKGKKLAKTNSANIFDSIIEIRNKKKGHTLSLPQSEYEELYNDTKEEILKLFEALEFLTQYTLVSPVEFEENKITYYQELKGSSIEEIFEEIEIGSNLIEGAIILFDDNSKGRHIVLSPLSYWEISYDEMEQYMCLYENTKLKGEDLKQVTYTGLTQTAKSKNIVLNQEDEDYFDLLKQFKSLISIFISNLISSSPQIQVQSNQRYYFLGQKPLIAFHNKFFSGRLNLLNSVNLHLRENESGYIYIEGIPGQGKSAFLAMLVKSGNYPHHFISRNEGRNEEKSLIQSLYYQIAEEIGLASYKIAEDVDSLIRDFNGLLFQYSEWCDRNTKKRTILVDALDEMNEENREILIKYFPQYLPKNLFIIFSSRPIKKILELEERIDWKMALEELKFEDVKDVALKQGKNLNNELLLNIYDISRGNPLLLKGILDEIDSFVEGDKIVIQLPNKIEIIFSSLLEKLRESEGQTTLEILGILAVSKGGLTGYELSKILNKSKFEILKSTRPIYQYLIISDNRYSLYHKKFSDFIIDPTNEYSLDDSEISNFHQAIINFFEKPENEASHYALKYLVAHYFLLNRIGEIQALIQKEEYQESFIDLLGDYLVRIDSVTPNERQKLSRLIDGIIDSNHEDGHLCLLNAFEEGIYFGVLDFCLPFLVKMKEKYLNSKYRNYFISEYLIGRVTREKGNLKEALDIFGELNAVIPSDITNDYLLKVKVQYANACREYGIHEDAIKYYDEALDLCSKESSPDQFLEINQHMSDLIYVRGNFRKAKVELEEGIELANRKGLDLREGQLKRILGQIYYASEWFEESLQYFYESLDLFNKLKDKIHLGKIYNNISLSECYHDLEKALEFANLALEMNANLGRGLEVGKSYINLGLINSHKEYFDQAILYANKSIEKFDEVGYQSGFASAFHYKAKILYRMNEYEQALELIDESNKILYTRKVLGDPFYVVKNQLLASIIHAKIGNTDVSSFALNNLPKLNMVDESDDYLERFRENIESKFPLGRKD